MIRTKLTSELNRARTGMIAGALAVALSGAPVTHAQPGGSTAPAGSPLPNAGAAPPGLDPSRPPVNAPTSTGLPTSIPGAPPAVAPTAPRVPSSARGSIPSPGRVQPGTNQPGANAQPIETDALQAELEAKPGGLTAEEIVALALKNSPALKKTELDTQKARANGVRARLAFAPRIDFAAKYTRLSKVPIRSFTLPGADPMTGEPMTNTFALTPPLWNQYATQASLMLPITDYFLTIIPTYKGAALLGDVAEHQQKAQYLQVSYDARVAFYNYVHLIGAEVVTRTSVRTLEAGLKDLEALVAAGTATQSEIVRAKSQLASAQALHAQAEGGVEVAREQLIQITGSVIDFGRGVGEPLVGIEIGEPPTTAQVRDEAKQSRPELLALRTLKTAREHLLRARKGAQYPQIRGTANAYYSNPNQRVFPQTDQWRGTWDVGVGVVWSPNDAVLAHVQADDAEVDLRMVDEDLRLTEQGIAMEAASAVTNHRAASASIAARTDAFTSAQRNYADQRSLLQAGAATPNEVLVAESELVQAALEYVDSFVQARIAQAALLKAQGKTGLARESATSAR
jgi:outer membrane protein